MKEPLTNLLNNVAALIKVKTILTFVLPAVFSYLAIAGTVQSQDVVTIFLMVISFYFGTQSKKE